MVSMARQRRLLLARTGWATVVDPRGRDEMERSVIGAIGPGGQSRIAPVRAAAAAADAVGGLAERLVDAGLAVPHDTRTTVASGVRQARAAAVVVLALGVTALLFPATPDLHRDLVALWFALPLALTLSCRPQHGWRCIRTRAGRPRPVSGCRARWRDAPRAGATTARIRPPWPSGASARSANRTCGPPSPTASRTDTAETRPGARPIAGGRTGGIGADTRRWCLPSPRAEPTIPCVAAVHRRDTRCEPPPSIRPQEPCS